MSCLVLIFSCNRTSQIYVETYSGNIETQIVIQAVSQIINNAMNKLELPDQY
jgi:hypothetical protein